MKKLRIPLSVTCLICILSIIGCDNHKVVKVNPVVFDSIQVEASYHLFNDQKKPNCNLSIHFVFPATCGDSSKLQSIRDVFVKGYFGDDYEGKSPQEAVESYKAEYLANYKTLESGYEEELKYRGMDDNDNDDESFFSYYENSFNTITYNKGNILVFVVNYSDYTGGAHGSNIHSSFVINLKTGQLIREEDIFYEDSLDKIGQAILHKIMEENEVNEASELEYLGYDINAIIPNGNFTVDDNGITYYYNEYEIAPYVMGTIKAFLPYNEISIYMKKESPLSSILNH